MATYIKNTQNSLGKYVKKPPLTDKLLGMLDRFIWQLKIDKNYASFFRETAIQISARCDFCDNQ